jgi:hypothetical protein
MLSPLGADVVSSMTVSSSVPAANETIISSMSVAASTDTVQLSSATISTRPVRAIHLTASAAGSKKYRKNHLEKMFSDTVINAVIIDIKEEEGYVYVPGVKQAERAGAYARDIPDLGAWLADLKKRDIYTVARIVAFKDNIMPRKNPSLGVHNHNGDLWYDHKKLTWLDPYNQESWKYLLLISLQCAKMGFDEVQFDYIRFPTDGALSQMRFIKPYSKAAASRALTDFLHQASQLLHPLGTKISIDVFGLTTTVTSGMGIGQVLAPMAQEVDFVCPMTYPSHYAKGEYGIPNPNDQPYHTIHLAVRDALKALGPTNAQKLRPYYQDFSLKGRGVRYGPDQVRAQIQAAVDLGAPNWTLWNASCKYTISALTTPFMPGPLPRDALEASNHHKKPSVHAKKVPAPTASLSTLTAPQSSTVNP